MKSLAVWIVAAGLICGAPGRRYAIARNLRRLCSLGKLRVADHGSDSGADGAGEVREPRMHQLTRQKGSITDAIFEIPGSRRRRVFINMFG
jgi:hypothetical protein